MLSFRRLFVACWLGMWTLVANAQSPESVRSDRLIDSEKYVGGGIVKRSTEKDLIGLYGAKNVQRSKIWVGEGESVEGTVLFPGTVDLVEIEWKENLGNPERVTISSEGTHWRTIEGITIGSSLEEVEKINGRSFMITGFGWDYPGRTVSWEDGKLKPSLQLEFVPTSEVTPQEIRQVLGDKDFSSNHPVIRKMKLKVGRIFVRW